MKYNYEFAVNEHGTILLTGLPFKCRYVEVPRENQFRALYSYVLIDIDLYYAINYLERCAEATNDIERQCFFRMAVIQYAKCYSSSKNGGRSPLNEAKVYKDLAGDPIGCHHKFIEMRNKYFAHDENDFKYAKLGAVLNVDDHIVAGIAYPRMQAKFDYDNNISILRTLCKKTKNWVQDKLDKETDRISQYIEQKGFDVLNEYENMIIN